MITKQLKDIAKMIDPQLEATGFEDVVIRGVSIDSRKIQKGNLFVPFKGEHTDGHRYVEAAVKQGAAAALWQKDAGQPPSGLPVILVEDTLTALQELARSYRKQLNVKVLGITGSNGKTTTKDMSASLLGVKYRVQKTEGNFNNHIGLPLTILSLQEDTEVAVLEMGMSAKGEIAFLTKLARPDAVVITNIGESHLQDLGSREAIADAKLEIIQGLGENGTIIYHGDEPLLRERLREYKGSASLQTFGKSESNDLFPETVQQDGAGNEFTVNGVPETFHLPVLGMHNVLNALAAMQAARFFGVPYDEMNKGFSTLKLTNMRMELVKGANGESIINDAYNASPTSMKAAIELAAGLEGYDKKVLVLGDMLELGPEEEKFHYDIGVSLVPGQVDYLLTFGALGQHIGQGEKESLGADRVFSFQDKEELKNKMKELSAPQTLFLVKASRGMRLEEAVLHLQENN